MKNINSALRLNPAANESLIVMLENQVGIMLPLSLRRFLNLADGAKTNSPLTINILGPTGIKRFCLEDLCSINDAMSHRRRALDVPSHMLTISEDKAKNKLLIDLVRGCIFFKERSLTPYVEKARPSKVEKGFVIFESFDGLIQFISKGYSESGMLFTRAL